ncbi:hypothetical protein MMP66_17090 [Acinetobacter dispersus]|uniref:hypothetical protein n=1 Tax=Acinetobacter dispersus TaxID=70348 RepID=UPI001F4AFD9D|nr:hypothetical protein [Acinetobacter dispersus]MCH7395964.1 hypothetical protein [Acinetobacter dispersus]
MLKEVIRNNNDDLENNFLNESRETSEINHELFNHYSNFQDAFTNYCIITNQEDLLNNIEEARESILRVYEAL